MNNSSLSQWLAHLETLHPCEIDLGLTRVAAVARKLELLPPQCKVITVAGTNGKGSVVATMEAVLAGMGVQTGACTSPHLSRFNERIRVAGREASDADIVQAFEQIERARGDTSLTYFEFATLAALVVFRQHRVSVALLEVGLGGRLDAVNIVDADAAVITSIDLDHQNWLGDTREQIALEKAGVLRAGKPAVIADPSPPQSLREQVALLGCIPCYSGKDYTLEEGEGGWSARLQRPGGTQLELGARPSGSLLADNICAGLQALLLLGYEAAPAVLDEALAGLQVKGRRESRRVAGIHYILDVAHNVAAVTKLLQYLDSSDCSGKTIALFSPMADKDIPGILQACASYFDAWFTADQPGVERAARAAEVADELRRCGCGIISSSKNIRQAFRRAQSIMAEGDRLVVFGSFNTVAEVSAQLDKDSGKR